MMELVEDEIIQNKKSDDPTCDPHTSCDVYVVSGEEDNVVEVESKGKCFGLDSFHDGSDDTEDAGLFYFSYFSWKNVCRRINNLSMLLNFSFHCGYCICDLPHILTGAVSYKYFIYRDLSCTLLPITLLSMFIRHHHANSY